MGRGPEFRSLSEEEMGITPQVDATVADARDVNIEKKFEVEIRKEDIIDSKARMEEERNKEGVSGKQSFIFIGAALRTLAEKAPEAGIETYELTDEDIINCKKRLESDIAGARDIKTKAGIKKVAEINNKEASIAQAKGRPAVVLSQEQTEEIIEKLVVSEQVWTTLFQKSNLKDSVGPEKFHEKNLELTKEEWKSSITDLQDKINEGNYHDIIPRAGHMHNLEPEKFNQEVLPMFTDTEKEGILGEINKEREENSGELASMVRYVSEFIPELEDQIVLDEKDWDSMEKRLEKARINKDYRNLSYGYCNMKIIEKNGRIKKVGKNSEAINSSAE